jgi:hypothetical protein
MNTTTIDGSGTFTNNNTNYMNFKELSDIVVFETISSLVDDTIISNCFINYTCTETCNVWYTNGHVIQNQNSS